MTRTATIRVSEETRDLLAAQAQEQGVSISAMLAELARRTRLESVYRAEREASRHDVASAHVAAEDLEWETTSADGID